MISFSGPADLPESLPSEFLLPIPSIGGYQLSELKTLTHGEYRFKPRQESGELKLCCIRAAPSSTVALVMIVRDDFLGLERAILSAVSSVDEIAIGVDGRSCPETLQIAAAYADTMKVFNFDDVGLSEEEWKKDQIHFANARNFIREQVRAPWSLGIDSDEMLQTDVDLRGFLSALSDKVGAVNISMVRPNKFTHRDTQRLARTRFRFYSPMHNQLPVEGEIVDKPDISLVYDDTLRPDAEQERRELQRSMGAAQLVHLGRSGDLVALFHAAKHYLGIGDPLGEQLTSEYRLRTEIHGPYKDERIWLALSAAGRLCMQGEQREAEVWGVRALLDGPTREAYVFLGKIAEADGDLSRALAWYESACVTDVAHRFSIPEETADCFERRDAIRARLQGA